MLFKKEACIIKEWFRKEMWNFTWQFSNGKYRKFQKKFGGGGVTPKFNYINRCAQIYKQVVLYSIKKKNLTYGMS